MIDIYNLLKEASISLIVVAIVVYLGRSYLEGWFKSRFTNLESLVKSSLSIKEHLRNQEQEELVAFRVCVEKWEYFLQTGIADLTIQSESPQFEPADFHKKDVEFFGAVRVAAVKAAIFLREPQLETELLKTITGIRQLYYPLLTETIQNVLAIQEQMLPYLMRMRQFELGGQKDLAVALNAEEAKVLIELRHKMTDELKAYMEKLVAQFEPIAVQLYELKEKINTHIYRPLSNSEIGK